METKPKMWFVAYSSCTWGQDENEMKIALLNARVEYGSTTAKKDKATFILYYVSEDFEHDHGTIKADVIYNLGRFDHDLKPITEFEYDNR